jgi:hypothetical protein
MKTPETKLPETAPERFEQLCGILSLGRFMMKPRTGR